MTAEQLTRRLLWLIPPRGAHLTNFHGDFASHAKARSRVLLPVPAEHSEAAMPEVAQRAPAPATDVPESALEPPRRGKRPRVDWASLQRHTFGCDVWQCPCGGRRCVVAVVMSARSAEEALRNMGLWQPRPPWPEAQGPPQRELVLDG